jgi:hypothetical protein
VATQTQFARFVEAPHPLKPTHRPMPRTFHESGNVAPSLSAVTALSLEFVATPQAVRHAHTAIPAEINEALNDVEGFAGCLTMISDQESRLVTVVTFWTGDDRAWRCSRTARWVQKLVAPYLDRCLRQRTFHAFLPAVSGLVSAFSSTKRLPRTAVGFARNKTIRCGSTSSLAGAAVAAVAERDTDSGSGWNAE